VPLLVVFVATGHLTKTTVTFHGADETLYHLPVIKQFLGVWPRPAWADYNSATGPLYHYLVAGWAHVVGDAVWQLRLFNVLTTWAFGIVFAAALRGAGATARWAILGSLAVVMSPYVFGVSFLLLTDNLALLFAAVSVVGLQASARGSRAGLLVATVSLALATLTRQPFAWLLAPYVMMGWQSRPDLRTTLGRLALGVVALIPLGILVVVIWRGLLPPTLQDKHQSGFYVRNIVFALALLGVLVLLALPLLVQRARETPKWAAAGAIVGAIVPVVMPLTPATGYNGWLWQVGRHLPSLGAIFLVFIPLVSLGGCAIALLLARRNEWASAVTLAAFLLALGANATSYQKYSEPVLLAGLILFVAAQPGRPLAHRYSSLCFPLVAGMGAGYMVLQNT